MPTYIAVTDDGQHFAFCKIGNTHTETKPSGMVTCNYLQGTRVTLEDTDPHPAFYGTPDAGNVVRVGKLLHEHLPAVHGALYTACLVLDQLLSRMETFSYPLVYKALGRVLPYEVTIGIVRMLEDEGLIERVANDPAHYQGTRGFILTEKAGYFMGERSRHSPRNPASRYDRIVIRRMTKERYSLLIHCLNTPNPRLACDLLEQRPSELLDEVKEAWWIETLSLEDQLDTTGLIPHILESDRSRYETIWQERISTLREDTLKAVQADLAEPNTVVESWLSAGKPGKRTLAIIEELRTRHQA